MAEPVRPRVRKASIQYSVVAQIGGGGGIGPFQSCSVRRCNRTQADRVRSSCSRLSGRVGSQRSAWKSCQIGVWGQRGSSNGRSPFLSSMRRWRVRRRRDRQHHSFGIFGTSDRPIAQPALTCAPSEASRSRSDPAASRRRRFIAVRAHRRTTDTEQNPLGTEQRPTGRDPDLAAKTSGLPTKTREDRARSTIARKAETQAPDRPAGSTADLRSRFSQGSAITAHTSRTCSRITMPRYTNAE